MSDETKSNTDQGLRLPGVDDAIDALLDDVEGYEPDSAEHREMVQRAVAQDASMRYAIGRQYIANVAAIERLEREQKAVWERYHEAMRPHAMRANVLAEILEQMALMARESGQGNTMVIPGIGKWSTRRVNGRWDLTADSILAALEGDDRQQFVETVRPEPYDKLDRQAFVTHLATLLEDSIAGQKLTDGEITDAAETVAATFEGVAYVPPRITVTMKLEGGQDDEPADD